MGQHHNIAVVSGIPAPIGVKPHEMKVGHAYRRVGVTSEAVNYYNCLVIEGLSAIPGKYVLDLGDMRVAPILHDSLHGMRFIESPITITTA